MTLSWEPCFETGIAEVDREHRKLVELINQATLALSSGAAPDGRRFASLVVQLHEYAARHFADEEALIDRHRLDPVHARHHLASHFRFIATLTDLEARLESEGASTIGPQLVRFLIGWLIFHIIDEDRQMARQIELVAKGVSPRDAWQQSQLGAYDEQARSALVNALVDLYSVLGESNCEVLRSNTRLNETLQILEETNRNLETRVAEAVEKVERTQQQLLQSEKMAAIGQLAAGVAHEINNPVGFVNSNLGSLRKYVNDLLTVVDGAADLADGLPKDDPAATRFRDLRRRVDLDFLRGDILDLLEESSQGLARVTRIVQDLRDFSHADRSGDWCLADLAKGLDASLNVVWNELKYKAEVKRTLPALPSVRCIPGQINQVFVNLLVNAAQAIEDHGVIEITGGSDEDWVWIDIADSGKGMDPATTARIFEPFFTTKPVGQGTGLGLSVSWEIIVSRHHGRIEVSSAPGAGTSFRISLPRGERSGAAVA